MVVELADVNDHAPTFEAPRVEFTIPEGQYPGNSYVGMLRAVDGDSGSFLLTHRPFVARNLG